MVIPPESGVATCMNCRWLFISPDPERIRRCWDCKQTEDSYEPPTAKITQVEGSLQSYQDGS
jgi:hypothetical protein